MESVLVLENDAPPAVRDAVNDFIALVGKATGIKMDSSETPVPGKNNIVLQWEDRRPDEADRFTIHFPKKDLMQITGSGESVGYALEYIQEKAFKIRRLTPNYADSYWRDRPERIDRSLEISCGKVGSAAIARKDVSKTASFNYKRRLHTHASGWYVRNSFYGIHDMTSWAFPYTKYGPDNSWPKEILPVINGRRIDLSIKNRSTIKIGWQPCWSNPASVRIAVENILEQLEIAKKNNKKVYSINLDVNDCGGCCQCEECLAALKKEPKNFLGSRYNYSNLYWKWVNGVAEAVTGKYPDLYINCLAYREVIDPPLFKLHPNVIPQICKELTACLDPETREKVESLFRNWSEKANVIFLWDYQYGANSFYAFPRIYFHKQAELFRMVYRNRVRGVFVEGKDLMGMEGPKHYLNAKLLWDLDTDVDKAVWEWYVAAGGKKAAPCLAEYFKFWEKYWLRPELGKTNWFSSVRSTYLQLGEQGTYTYALRKGEMAYLRSLLEKALANAETPDQKKRMEIYLNECFSTMEASAKCLFSEYLNTDGTLASAKDAVELLKSVPDAARALQFLKTKSIQIKSLQRIMEGGFVSNINTVIPFLKDPAVREEIRKLADDTTLPKALQAQLQLLLGKKYTNLFPEGSFETGRVPRGMTPDTKHVSLGKRSVCFRNGRYALSANGIKPGKTYYIAADVYSTNASLEGKFNFMVAPRSGTRTLDWKKIANLKLAKGWQTIAFAYQTPTQFKVDNFYLVVQTDYFELDEMLWMDNFRIYQLD